MVNGSRSVAMLNEGLGKVLRYRAYGMQILAEL
jgi:hypothetical protein